MKQLVSIDEAAAYFKICRRTFTTIIKNNPVKFLQVGKQKRFDLAELERCFEKISGSQIETNKETISRRQVKESPDYSQFYELLN